MKIRVNLPKPSKRFLNFPKKVILHLNFGFDGGTCKEVIIPGDVTECVLDIPDGYVYRWNRKDDCMDESTYHITVQYTKPGSSRSENYEVIPQEYNPQSPD